MSSPAVASRTSPLRGIPDCLIPRFGNSVESRAPPRFPDVEELPDEALFTSALAASVALVQERLFWGAACRSPQLFVLW